jgi:hypothetical protein
MDVPNVHRYAAEAADIAERIGRHDIVLGARGWRGGAYGADGMVDRGIQEFDEVVRQASEIAAAPPANVLTSHSLALYWLGRLD